MEPFLTLVTDAFPRAQLHSFAAYREAHMSQTNLKFKLTRYILHVEVWIAADGRLLAPAASSPIGWKFDHSLLPAVACNACR